MYEVMYTNKLYIFVVSCLYIIEKKVDLIIEFVELC